MKTLKINALLITVMMAIISFAACKKSDNGPDGRSTLGSYKFNGTGYPIRAAAEKHIAGDIFLEFTSGNAGDYLQINLPNTASLPIGLLTYNANRYQGYDPLKNFWSTGVGVGGVNTDATGGTATIAKTDKGYKIVFNIATAKGNITGEYNGTPAKN